MRRLALNRCLRAAPSETLLAAVFVCLLIVLLRNDAHAQFLPSGCPGQWVQGGGGMMCLCPDGTYANMVGNQIVCPSRVQTQPQVGDYCSNGGTCGVGYKCSWMPGKCVPEGKVDCGEYFCQSGQTCSSDPTYRHCLSQGEVDCGSYHCSAGYKCSSAKCIAQDAVDCGNGSYCSAGRKCSPDGKLCIGINEVDCGSYRCSPGLKCGSGNTCLHRDWVDCGGGKSCAPGQVCVNGGSECLTSAQIADRAARAARLPNIGDRARAQNLDVLVICGAAALGVALLLIFVKPRRGVEQGSIHEEPKLLETKPPAAGGAPSEKHAASPVASERHEVSSRSEPSGEHPDAVRAEPSSVHDHSPRAAKTYAFIDASNLFYGGEKSLGWKVDYRKLLTYLRTKYGVSKAFYFGGVEINDFQYDYLCEDTVPIGALERHLMELLKKPGKFSDAEVLQVKQHLNRVRFYRKLEEFGYELSLKPVKSYVQEDGTTRRKANCDVDMTYHIMREEDNFERALILSGDGDFLAVLKQMRKSGKQVIVLARGSRTAKEIRKFAGDDFSDFEYLRELLKMH